MTRASQSLMPFLAPSAYRQPAARVSFASRHSRAQPMQNTASRTFTTSLRKRQADDTRKDSREHPDSPAQSTSASQDISRILDGALDMKKGTPTTPSARTSRFASNNAQEVSTPSRQQLTADRQQGSSMDDLMKSFTAPRAPSSFKRDIAGSLNPRGARAGPPPIPQPAPMKLGPTLGRTVYVDNARGVDVAKAFQRMEISVARNTVRKDFNRQRFHERGGTKRKRLHSERWRRRFKAGFQAVVKRVLKMKKQGW